MYGNDMKFLKSHEWIKLEQDNIAYIGISDHAQSLLGDVVYLELPKVGQHINMHDTIGVVESVKAASDLYSPASGEVIAINEEAVNNPSILNSDPHLSGWLIKIKLSKTSELEQLINATDYQNLIC